MTHALVVLKHKGKIMLVFDRYKKKLQFPGGLIEAGETAREAAARELLEETNQTADLLFLGIMHWDLQGTRVLHQTGEVYGALFFAEKEHLDVFLENDEVSACQMVAVPEELGRLDPLIAGVLRAVSDRL
ncbi:NUDIX domain-containing protein [Deinococcus cellulosilyticus]